MKIDIDQAALLLKQEKLVSFPTETVYGLGAIATSESAITAVYETKHRPHDNPLICHFASPSQIKQYTSHIPNYWDVLVSHFSPGPVSYLLTCADTSLYHATRGLPNVLCRIPNHPLTLKLIEKVGVPIVGPSANPSGQPSATDAQMVEEYFADAVPVVDGGSSWIGLESTILDCTSEDRIVILRPGQIGVAELQSVLYAAGYTIPVLLKSDEGGAIIPGSKYRHYSPHTLIYKTRQRDPVHDRGDIALIGPTELLDRVQTTEVTHRIDLGSAYMPSTIAHNLYKHLHHLDSLGVRHAYLLMWKMGDSGIERALFDRLTRIGDWREDDIAQE